MSTERPDNGILIAFEGIDGAGKTTQVGLLADFLTSCGETVVRSKEPTDGRWGQLIRQSATNGRMTLTEELHALIEDRKEHVREVIQPALDRGETVILDRYFYSTIAYQGSAGGNPEAVAERMLAAFPIPDAVILIDVPPAVGVSRIEQGRRETPNRFEQTETLTAVRKAFLELAKGQDNVSQVDGTRSVEDVRRTIFRSLLEGVLKKKYCAKQYGCDDELHCGYRISGTCRWAAMCKRSGALS